MTSLYNDLSRLLRMDHNYFQFNDDVPKHSLRERLEEILRKSSFISNGKAFVLLQLLHLVLFAVCVSVTLASEVQLLNQGH